MSRPPHDTDVAMMTRLAQGRSSAQVARELSISKGAFNMRLYRLRQQYGALTTVHLIAIAVTRGVIAP